VYGAERVGASANDEPNIEIQLSYRFDLRHARTAARAALFGSRSMQNQKFLEYRACAQSTSPLLSKDKGVEELIRIGAEALTSQFSGKRQSLAKFKIPDLTPDVRNPEPSLTQARTSSRRTASAGPKKPLRHWCPSGGRRGRQNIVNLFVKARGLKESADRVRVRVPH